MLTRRETLSTCCHSHSQEIVDPSLRFIAKLKISSARLQKRTLVTLLVYILRELEPTLSPTHLSHLLRQLQPFLFKLLIRAGQFLLYLVKPVQGCR